MNKYMQEAINEAYSGIRNGDGGPFGAVIVKEGKIIGKGHNKVVKNNDPTNHGEVDAIRDACRNIGSFDLSGCELYTTGEPCTMCLAASMWANIERIFYGCTIKDNENIGFRDDKIDKIFGGREKLPGYLTELDRAECLKLFEDYNNIKEKTMY